MSKTLEKKRAEAAARISGYEQEPAVIQRKNVYRDRHRMITDPVALAKLQDAVRERKDALEAELKEVNAEYDVIRIELLPTLMEDQGFENLRIVDLGRVSVTPDAFVSVKSGGKLGLFSWLKKRKLGDLIQPGVNSSTLKAFVKDRVKAGKEVPEEFLNVTFYTRASITKG